MRYLFLRSFSPLLPSATMKKRVAVVGSGVAGLGCTWMLSNSGEDFQVTLYEKGTYLGGHTNTVDIHSKKVITLARSLNP